MKIALKELQKEKMMRNYIRVYSMKLQKENSIISKKDSIIQALTEWKKM